MKTWTQNSESDIVDGCTTYANSKRRILPDILRINKP